MKPDCKTYDDFEAAGIDMKKPVHVYYNLHHGKWSVRQNGIVKAHTESVELKDCEMVVQPAGRAKVLREKKKNVHAYVKGTISIIQSDFEWHKKLRYNPYKSDKFFQVYEGSSEPIEKSWRVTLGKHDATTYGG